MTGKELLELYMGGHRSVVKFKEGIEDSESFDPEMMARLDSIKAYDTDSLICTFDFTEFEEYNKTIEEPVFNGNNGELLRWSESPYYPKDKRVEIWIGYEEIGLFEVTEENQVYKDYKNSGSDKSYVQWLEDQYLKRK